jgi:hypothetical protein
MVPVRFAGFVVCLLVLVSAVPSGAQAPGAEVVGAFTAPFVENPQQEERCVEDENGALVCKPVAVSAVALRDGRVLYWNGLEGFENIVSNTGAEAAGASRNSRARLLDLRGGQPVYEAPTPEDGTVGPRSPGSSGEGPLGTAGVPGKPGDGLVGSTVGQVVSGPSSSPPDDEELNDRDMFCSYQVQLSDGRVLIMGGTDWYYEPDGPGEANSTELDGLYESRVFDPATNTFSKSGDMAYGRWYPSSVTLGDGKVFVASGVVKLIKSTQLSNVRRSETYDPATGQWTENFTGPASETSLPLYPRMRLMPNGKIFYAAAGQTWNPFGQAADEALWTLYKFFDPETKTWQNLQPSQLVFRGSPLDVLLPLRPPYDEATILQAGGVLGTSPGTYLAVPFTEEITVDADGQVSVERTGDLTHARWFPTGVLLPDGTVLTVSGGDRDAVVAPGTEAALRQAEIYNPETKEWTPAATAERSRVYHNSAILLADGRVLVGGHSTFSEYYGGGEAEPPAPEHRDPTFEVYSPPYLFRGERPEIRQAPAGVAWGESFDATVSSPTPIESVMLLRLGATTHVLDNDQRALYLDFAQQGSQLRVQAPPDGTAAPPGPYYLVANRTTPDGPVPSVAAIVTVGPTSDATPALVPFPGQSGVAGGTTAPPAPAAQAPAPDAPAAQPQAAPADPAPSGRLPATGSGLGALGVLAVGAAALLRRAGSRR